jgi:hypothetical protein
LRVRECFGGGGGFSLLALAAPLVLVAV